MIWKRLPTNQSHWLMLESHDTPMHIGALLTFKLPEQATDTFLRDIANGFRGSRTPAAPWNHRFKKHLATALMTSVEKVAELDLGYHFRHLALPHPGGERELGILVSRLHSNPLDKQRPPWEVHLIEGLENNRFAVYLKLHPVLINSTDLTSILHQALSTASNDDNMPPFWSIDMNVDAKTDTDIRDLLKLQKLSTGWLQTEAESPQLAPRSPLNGAVNSQRRFATQQYDYYRLQRLAKSAECEPSTILAYLCSSALRRFFKEHNALPDASLIASATLPADTGSPDSKQQPTIDLLLTLATHIADPLQRLQALNNAMQQARNNLSDLPDSLHASNAIAASVPQLLRQLPGIGWLMPNLSNVGISSTTLTEQSLYFNGAELEAVYPMACLTQNRALSFDSVVYAGTINIGITGARDTLPRLQRMALYMEQALNDLETLLQESEAKK